MDKVFDTGKYRFDTSHTVICGILNLTPDSFSDGGLIRNEEEALKKAIKLIEDGADFIDIGGESTRPGSNAIPYEVEIERIRSVLRMIKRNTDICISVDTQHYQTAYMALENGADIINDINGFTDDNMLDVVKKSGSAVIAMVNKPSVGKDICDFIKNEYGAITQRLTGAGIPINRICLDPGFGFSKTQEENLSLLMNCPVSSQTVTLAGISRKSFIGTASGVDIPENRISGTVAGNTLLIKNGINILRVHDVKICAEAARTVDMIKRVSNGYCNNKRA